MDAAGCWALVLGREPEARIAPERLINVSHRRVAQIDPTVPRLVLELQEALTALGLRRNFVSSSHGNGLQLRS